MKILAALAVVASVGCQGDDPDVSKVTSDIVNPTTPYVGPAVNSITAYPALGVHGRVVEGPYNSTSKDAPHLAGFSDGVDLEASPVVLESSTAGDRAGWADTLGARSDAAYVQPPATVPRVKEALDSASARMASLSTAALSDAAEVFRLIPGFTEPVISDRDDVFAAWLPPRARWLDSQWAFAPRTIFTPPQPATHFMYPTPSAFALLPERGARLYCAAREMAFHQERGSLGEKVLLPISILGQDIDIGVFEPFAYVDQPEKFTAGGANDGVQAFNIPLQLGVKISPVRPFLPSLPELRYPLVLTTADTELVTDTDRGLVWEDNVCVGFGGFCHPVIRNDYQKRFKTVTHVDSTLSAGQSMKTTANFPLFWAGPLLVSLNLGFGASVGTTVPPLGEEHVSDRPKVFDDRILSLQTPPAGWPTEVRSGTASGVYLDGYWRLPQSYFNPDPGSQFYDVHSLVEAVDTVVAVAVLLTQSAFRTAVLADDDHHVGPMSELALDAGLQGEIGFNAFLASINIKARGDIKGVLGLAHDIRDAISADTSLLSTQPVRNLIITPTTYGKADLNFVVNFHLHISLFWDDIDVDYDLVNKTIPVLPESSSAWSEEHRVRLGTASTVGPDMTQQPLFTSHTGTVSFASFPQPVSACLADPTTPPAVPPACGSTPATGVPMRFESCIYMEISNQIDPCTNIPPITDIMTPHDRCEATKLTYMCSPVRREQWWGSQFVLAHRLDLPADDGAASDELRRMRDVVSACAEADRDTIPAGGLTDWFKTRFKISPCDAGATLLDAARVVEEHPIGVTAGSCPPPSP
ncbi:MAG TPA: hypothetical protein VIV40_16980 [Kofleriaceae bacterium]